MVRVGFFVDGFNLYHSLNEAQLASQGRGTRWLDLGALCRWLTPQVDPRGERGPIHFFSALAIHRAQVEPARIQRQRDYLDCLKATGIHVHLGDFKQRARSNCPNCHQLLPASYEEKRSDVGIAVTLLECFVQDHCDAAVLVTGDTDQIPAIESARRLFPQRPVHVVCPYARHSDELVAVAAGSVRLKKSHYPKSQFPDPFVLPDGRVIAKPAGW